MNDSLYIGCDNLIVLDELLDRETGEFINDATVTFTVLDSNGAAVHADYTNIAMDYVTDSNGRYTGVLDEAISLTEGSVYYVEINAEASDDRKDKRRLRRTARYRGEE